jgi:hypothetical protein
MSGAAPMPTSSGRPNAGIKYGEAGAVCPKGATAIAYAGQPVISGGRLPGYNQDFNYAFLDRRWSVVMEPLPRSLRDRPDPCRA